jgi:MoxR-like ATPase
MQTPSPFAVFSNIQSPRQKEAFQCQIREFSAFITRKTQRLLEPLPDGILPVRVPTEGRDLCHKAFMDYHLRCRLMDLVADWMLCEKLEPHRGLAIIRYAAVTLFTLASSDKEDHLDVLRSAYEWLNRIHPRFPLFLTVAHCNTLTELVPQDDLAWVALLEGGQPVFSWDTRKLVLGGEEQPSAVPPSPSFMPLRLSASQAEAFQELGTFWALQREGAEVAAIRIRPYPLLVGPSGCGKSALVRHFAFDEVLPLLELSCGAWVVTGARTEPHTMMTILNYVRREPEGIIFIDEVDKFVARTDWNTAIQQEVYSLLDGRLSGYPEWMGEDVRKLQSSFLIIGAGTWQHLYKAGAQTLGFGGSASGLNIQYQIENENAIPEELLFRFNARLIEIQPMTAAELAQRIEAIHRELVMPKLESSTLDALVREAIASRKNTRWLEAYLFSILRDPRNRWRPETHHPGRILLKAPSETQAA